MRQAVEVTTSFGTMEAEVFALIWKGDTVGDWVARMNDAKRAPPSHLLKPLWTHIMPPGDDRMASWSA